MSNVIELRTLDDIYESASQWLAKMDRGLSSDEELQLKSWLAVDARHAEILLHMASLWDRMDHLALLSALFPVPAAEPTKPKTARWLALAASVAALSFGVAAYVNVSNHQPQSLQAAWQQPQAETVTLLDGQYETAVGEQRTITLPDTSELVLNTNSQVRVLYTNKQRLLMLERGELHIQVAHDTERPLSVLAGKKIMQAVGTAFGVHILDEEKVSLLVTDGRVLVGNRQEINPQATTKTKIKRLEQNSVSVVKGEKILLGAPTEIRETVSTEEMNAELSWRQGNVIFHGEPLSDVINELGRYTKYSWEIADDSIRTTRIAGLFKTGDQTALLQTLASNFPITYEITGTHKIILHAKDEK